MVRLPNNRAEIHFEVRDLAAGSQCREYAVVWLAV